MRETWYNTRDVNTSRLGTVEGYKEDVCMCVCIPDREYPPMPHPPPAVYPAQTVALCLVPRPRRRASWSLGAGVSLTPTNPPCPLLTSIKAIIPDREPYYAIWPQLASHTGRQRERGRRQERQNKKEKRHLVAHSSVSKYSIFPRPTQPLVFVMVPFFLIKDVDMRSVGWESRSVETFVWLFEEWCFDGVCECRREAGGWLRRPETSGWPVRDTRLVRASRDAVQRSPGLGSTHEWAH